MRRETAAVSVLAVLAAPRSCRSLSSPLPVLAAKTTPARHPHRQASLHSLAPLAPQSSRRSLRSLCYARTTALVAPLCSSPPSLYIRAAADPPPLILLSAVGKNNALITPPSTPLFWCVLPLLPPLPPHAPSAPVASAAPSASSLLSRRSRRSLSLLPPLLPLAPAGSRRTAPLTTSHHRPPSPLWQAQLMVQLPPPGESTSTSTPSRPSLSSAQLPPGTGATHSLHFAPPSALFPPSSPRSTPSWYARRSRRCTRRSRI